MTCSRNSKLCKRKRRILNLGKLPWGNSLHLANYGRQNVILKGDKCSLQGMFLNGYLA